MRIENIVDQHFPEDFLDKFGDGKLRVLDIKNIRKNLLNCADTGITERILGFSQAVIEAGIAGRINSDHRGIPSYDQWNKMVDEPQSTPEPRLLLQTPIARNIIFKICDVFISENLAWLKDKGEVYPFSDEIDNTELPEEIWRRSVKRAVSEVRANLIEGVVLHNIVSRCDLTGQGLTLLSGTDLYRPVLMVQNAGGNEYTLAPEIEAPRPIRHLEINLPSGRLVMTDALSIPGFLEMANQACVGTHSLNRAVGVNERTERMLTELGIVYVMCDQLSPAAYLEEEGVIRMGFIDEDHEVFWNEDGDRSEVEMPAEQWRTCTDVWANIFADFETMIDVLMKSCEYSSRHEAAEAIESYCSKDYGSNIIDLEPGPLHVYMATGHNSFDDHFEAEEVSIREWQKDAYVLARKPLTLKNPDLVEEPGWEAPEIGVVATPMTP